LIAIYGAGDGLARAVIDCRLSKADVSVTLEEKLPSKKSYAARVECQPAVIRKPLLKQ
jgi:hypothetical protein